MPDWWGWTELAVVVIFIGLAAPVLGIYGRRRWLAASGRVFDCSLRPADATPGAGWMLGAARYSADRLEWYRVFSLSFRPWIVIDRTRTQVEVTRVPDALESAFLDPGQRIATFSGVDEGVSISLSQQDFTALLSWMEGGLPGRQVR